MNIAEPTWLLWIPAVLLLSGVAVFAGILHRRALEAVFSSHMLEQVLPQSVRTRRVIRDVAAFLGLALALVALSEPRFDKQIRTVEAEGTDVVLLMDLSRSMDATDVDPSRLERARREVSDLRRMAVGDRMGLVVFAGGAFPRLPLTEDLRAVELVVSETRTADFTTQGSDLAQAIRVALELLDNSKDQAGQAILVLSDGETHDVAEARTAASEAVAAGIPVYVMGIGIEQSPIPLPDGSLLMHEGQVATTVPDFGTLKEVAELTGGAFVQSNATDRDMVQLYREIRSNVQAVARSSQQRETWRTAYHWPLGAAMVLFLLAGWLGDGRRAFGAATVVLFALLLGPSDALAADLLTDADRSYRNGDYQTAVDLLTELSLEQPDDPDVFSRLGAARYRNQDWEGAARAFDRAAELDDDPSSHLFNSGNAHYRAGRLERAVERFRGAAESDPEHPAAANNGDLVEQEIELRRQVRPPPPPEPQPAPSDADSQDGNPEDQQEGEQEQPNPGEQSREGQPNETPPEGSPSEAGMEDQDEDAEPVDSASQENTSMGQDAGPITEGQAHRLLDAIEEGTPSVEIRGERGGKPW